MLLLTRVCRQRAVIWSATVCIRTLSRSTDGGSDDLACRCHEHFALHAMNDAQRA